MSDTEDLLAQLRFAAEVEREAYKQEGATYINPMATICGRAATTIEEAMKMLIERDDRIAQLEAAARCAPVVVGYVNEIDESLMRVQSCGEYWIEREQGLVERIPIYLDPQPPTKGE